MAATAGRKQLTLQPSLKRLGDKGAESAVGCNSLKETAHLAAHVKEEQLGDKGAEGAVGCGS